MLSIVLPYLYDAHVRVVRTKSNVVVGESETICELEAKPSKYMLEPAQKMKRFYSIFCIKYEKLSYIIRGILLLCMSSSYDT